MPSSDRSLEPSTRGGRLAATLTLAFVAVLLLAGLSGFGIWDPWELSPADRARDLAAGKDIDLRQPPLGLHLVALGFDAFGVREWAGRLPMALMGLLTAAVAYVLVSRFSGRRSGIYAMLILGTTPLFLFNGRQMLGEAPAFLAQALVALTAACAVFAPRAGTAPENPKRDRLARTAWGLALVVAITFAIFADGALLGALPPLLAVAVAAGLRGVPLGIRTHFDRTLTSWFVLVLTGVVVLFVANAVAADEAGYSHVLGGYPHGGDPPTFDRVLEDVFHAFAPWSALLLLALGRMLWPVDAASNEETSDGAFEAPADREAPLRLVLVLWAAFAYGATTLYLSRYGTATYGGAVALAGAVALLLRDVERSRQSWWAAGVIAILFVVLIVRDYGLYPGGPIAGLNLDGAEVPKEFNPKLEWTAFLALFAASTMLAFGAGPAERTLDPRAPLRWLRRQWGRGRAFRAWLAFAALIVGGLVIFGLVCFVAGPRTGLTTIVIKWGRRLTFVPVVVAIAVYAAQIVLYGASRLGRYRLVPVLAAGAAIGVYSAFGFLPSLSAHFSPREVYDTYNELAEPGEPLGEFRVGSRAAAYYAEGDIRELESQAALIGFLAEGDERRWAVLPADDLAAVDRGFRQRTNKHLFVPKARSARVTLVTNEPIEGRDNRNFLARFVREEAPDDIDHEVGARYEDKIELVGYDLELPHDGYVGAGEDFTVTWYWRALDRIPGSYKIFLHIDGQGLRLNGDHEPIDGKYPVRLWNKGDVVVDRQELSVPANYRPGNYTFFIGFFSGSNRLEVVQGPEDDANRVRAGVLRIR